METSKKKETSTIYEKYPKKLIRLKFVILEFKSRESSNMVAKIVNQISQHPSEYMKTQENDKYGKF